MRSTMAAAAFALGTAVLTTTPACAQRSAPDGAGTVAVPSGPVRVSVVAGGLTRPWGIAFLPDGRALVTEKAGRLRILNRDGSLSGALAGTPQVVARGQGGLLDVAVDPDFAQNRLVYLSYSEAGGGGVGTALGRGRLTEGRIEDFAVVFRQTPKVDGPNHFGNRIVFSPDGHLFLTLGERFKFDPAQDLGTTLGKVVRLNRDGSVPRDNPFSARAGADPAIWSYGHRNIQAADVHPGSGALWVAEMGPLGGDELNRPEPGRNYGWPLVSRGRHYDGRTIPDPTTRPDLADAALHWTPVISPAGMVFYTGNLFPEWRNTALIGGLSANAVVRVSVDGDAPREVERIPLGARVRDVAQGPDGAIYVLIDADDGGVWRIAPQDEPQASGN